jgi:hypothetical protein
VPTPTKDLRAFVGKQVRIKRDGVTHRGVLIGEAYCRVTSRKIRYKRWVLLTSDNGGTGFETHFKANDGWTVTVLRRNNGRARGVA